MVKIKKFITVFVGVAILVGLFTPTTGNTFGYANIISAIKQAVKYINLLKSSRTRTTIPGIFAFGGHITHSEGGCAIKYKVFLYNACYGFPCPPFPGPPIPLGGNTIEVGPPLSSPKGQMFTFPFVSDIYRNNSEDRVGPWALGLGLTPFPIDAINSALDAIPPIPIFDGDVRNFSLDCSENNKNVILKMGTSP